MIERQHGSEQPRQPVGSLIMNSIRRGTGHPPHWFLKLSGIPFVVQPTGMEPNDKNERERRELLHKNGFDEAEITLLSRLRKDYNEQERLLAVAEHRRFEFIRWLVIRGKLTDQIG